MMYNFLAYCWNWISNIILRIFASITHKKYWPVYVLFVLLVLSLSGFGVRVILASWSKLETSAPLLLSGGACIKLVLTYLYRGTTTGPAHVHLCLLPGYFWVMEESLRPVRQRGFPDQASRSLQPALPAYLGISQWERGISDPAEMESSHSIPCAGRVRLTWCLQKDSWKEWAYLGYFLLLGWKSRNLGSGCPSSVG